MFCSLVNGKCFCYVEIPNASVQARHRSKIFYLLSYYSSSIRSQRSWQCVHSLLKIKHCLAVKPHKLSEQSVQKKKIKKKIKYRHVFVFLICLNACVSILNIRQARKQTKKLKIIIIIKMVPRKSFSDFWNVQRHEKFCSIELINWKQTSQSLMENRYKFSKELAASADLLQSFSQ